MQVTIITETYPPDVNGVALTVQGLERRLRELGHGVTLVRPRQPGQTSDSNTVFVPSVALPRYPGLRLGLPAYSALARTWREQRPDVLYVATEGPLGASAIRVARRMHIPVATGYHTRFDQYMSRYGLRLLAGAARRWMRLLHNAGNATVVSTRALASELTMQGYRHAVHVPRAVDTERFDPARRAASLRQRWGVEGNAPVLLQVGRLAPEKNIDLAVKTYRQIRAHIPAARLVIVGDGPMRAALQSANPDIQFTGVRHDIDLAEHYAAADIFLFPSITETFGNVTLEAMASGLATVAFDDGAAREHIRHGINGCLATPGNDAAFIEEAVALACDPAKRLAIGQAARQATTLLDPAAVARAFEALLHSLIEGHSAPLPSPTGEMLP